MTAYKNPLLLHERGIERQSCRLQHDQRQMGCIKRRERAGNIGGRKVHPVERVIGGEITWIVQGNALRYGGGARVNLARETVAGHSTARITIEDDGPGIPEAAIAAMMEPFRRGEPSRNSLTGGAGLGLTLARAIAEQHGGSLTLANRLDGAGQIAGLVATLSLPLP